jgi:hypothetical protein
MYYLLPDDFHEYALVAAPVEFAVKNLLPRAEVEAALGDRHYHLAAHHLPLEMRIGVVLAGAIVPVLRNRFVGGELLQPLLVILVQAAFIVVDENGSGNVHRVDQNQSFLDAAFPKAGFHLAGDIDETAAGREIEPELFAVASHVAMIPRHEPRLEPWSGRVALVI